MIEAMLHRCVRWFLFLASAIPAIQDTAIPSSPFDQVVALELTAADESLVEGRGPARLVEYEVEFEGTLHVWTRSELDLFLRVEDAQDGELLGEDDDSGGGSTPYLRFEVSSGDVLAVVACGPPSATGELSLHLVAAPVTAATRAATAAMRQARSEASRLRDEGDQEAARASYRAALEPARSTAGAEHSEAIADALWEIGYEAYFVGGIDTSLTAWSSTLAQRERTLPPDHVELLAVRTNLAVAMEAQGDIPGARALKEAVLRAYERTLPADHPDLLLARNNLAVSLEAMGDTSGARALREAVLEVYERSLPAEHPELLRARANMALSLEAAGDLAGARALREAVLEARARSLPPDHPDLLLARAHLALSLQALGDLSGALGLREQVLEACERTLPADHPDLLTARANLAISLEATGDIRGARALRESVLEVRERTLPADHPDLLLARENLAFSMEAMGDQSGARALREAVVEAYERALPADHLDLVHARNNLALSMRAMGDVQGARALFELVLEACERSLPVDHPDHSRARNNLAAAMKEMGDVAGACALEQAVLVALERSLPADHPELLHARANLATSMQAMGDSSGARELREAVLEARERSLPADHPDLCRARESLAASMEAMGEISGARALRESVHAAREGSLRFDHPDLLRARSDLARSRRALGDTDGARALLPALCDGMRSRVLASLALSPRQVRQAVGSEVQRLSLVYFLGDSTDSELLQEVFGLAETMRSAASGATRSLAHHDRDPVLGPILEQADEIRRALNDLIAGQAGGVTDPDAVAAEVTRLSLERDRLEREAARRLAQRGVVSRPIEEQQLARSLQPADALVGYSRLTRWHQDEEGGALEPGVDHLFAHVLRRDGSLSRVDLGPAQELEQLVSAWRAALGAPLLRGVSVGDETQATREARAGQRLRVRLLDPVLAAAGADVERLFVAADDLVFLVPLDALPLDAEGAQRLGDRVRIVGEVSFARLIATQRSDAGSPALLAFGGVDYDAAGSAAPGVVAVSAPIVEGRAASRELASPEVDPSAARASMPATFRKLPQTRREVEATAEIFEEAFGLEPVLLTREATTKAALFEAAAKKRFVHLATHGWFAPESVRSTADAWAEVGGSARMGLEERVNGLAPMTLCGLALAGANHGRDSLGRVTGILTAEELCSLDLSQCELAVLSACETNVGVRRAGQGIQSLQAALYAAGARTSITSLWKVDDAATRSLMEAFYSNLWLEGMGKAEALWEAKKALREDGDPPAHWAGWVLTGDPD